MGATARVRRPLDRDVILAAALELAEDGGPDALSVRKLGQALGTDPTAIYRHFRDMEELTNAALDRILGVLVDSADVALPWRQRLMAFAEESIGVARRYPAIAPSVVLSRPTGPDELRSVEFVLQAFADAGLADQEQLDFYVLYVSYVLLFAAGSVAVDQSSDAVPWPDQPWIESMPAVPTDRFPQVTAALPRLLALRAHAVFRSGLDIILDSAEARARSTSVS